MQSCRAVQCTVPASSVPLVRHPLNASASHLPFCPSPWALSPALPHGPPPNGSPEYRGIHSTTE
ncbi:hypothetical protein LIA77_00123 [Sarocladium implicatum]|nr:hypothetical protein LIA77_00123 [Sarocladium implicatum]